MIKYLQSDAKYIDEALELVRQEYKNEQILSTQLPDWNYDTYARSILSEIFKQKYTMMAIEDGKLIGYLGFWGPIDGFFGEVKGAWSPLCGSAFAGNDRAKLASKLFEETTKPMVKDGIFCYAISRTANDTKVSQSLIFNGFGIRCSDAVMQLDKRHKSDLNTGNIIFCELDKADFSVVKPLRLKLDKHLWDAPVYFPVNINDFNEWSKREDLRIFVAKDNDQVIGFISIGDEGETYITRDSRMTNICGTYVAEEYRGRKIADALLEYVCQKIEAEGTKYLGVDCETLNPTALRFWRKYFQPYTYSYCRRIDERVKNYPF